MAETKTFAAEASPAAAPMATVINNFDYDQKIQTLTPTDVNRYLNLTDKLDYHNAATLQTYGSDLNSIISKNGDTLLNTVKSDNSVEVIGYINSLLSELNGFDEELDKYTNSHSSALKRFFYSLPFIKKVATSLDNVLNNYNTVAENVDKITEKISNAKIVALRDNTTLQQIFDCNTVYIQQLRDLIIAAKLKTAKCEEELETMKTCINIESYEINDMIDFIHKLKKRTADLQTSEYIMMQNLLQIRATQSNNIAIAEKTDNIITQVIPMWKNQLPLAIILKNQQASTDAQGKISETTNKLITKIASDLKVNSIAVAKASEESIISIDALKSTTQDLITTITEVKRIHKEGESNRANLENYLKDFSKQIANAVTTNR